MWYTLTTFLESDVTAQRRGLVHIQYEVSSAAGNAVDGKVHDDDDYRLPREIYTYGPLLNASLPMRVIAMHYCYDKAGMQPAMKFLRLIGSNIRCRFREHYGAVVECQYELMKFGIAPGIIPVDDDGKFRLDDFHNYVAMRKRKEEELAKDTKDATAAPSTSTSSTGSVAGMQQQQPQQEQQRVNLIIPTSTDVLMGRGRPYQDHKGNMYLSRLIDEYRSEYNGSSRMAKTRISWMLVNKIKERGGRFLKKSKLNDTGGTDGGGDDDLGGVDTYWEVCNLEAAREKVAHGFRSKPLRIAASSQQQHQLPTTITYNNNDGFSGKKRRFN